MDEKRIAAAQKLLDVAQEFWNACHEEGQYGAVQWLQDEGGRLLIYTRGEYRDRLLSNIVSLPDTKIHYFNGETIPFSED